MKPLTLRDRLPKTCTLEDVCRALNISRATYYARQAEHKFPIPELLPRLDRRPRFSGEKVLAYIEGRDRRSEDAVTPPLAPSVNTPTDYPPTFESYDAFRVHINALVARKEAEVRTGALAGKASHANE